MTTVDEVLTVKETAKVLRTNTSFVYQLIKKGFLPALKLGQLKVRRSTLMNFIESCEGTMTEKKRTRYLNLVKKRAYTLNQYESTGKEKYLRKVDAIDKVLDVLVIVMDQTRRLCG